MAIALVALPALAGPHFIGGVGFDLGSLVAQVNFAGYGSDNLVVTLTGSGTVIETVKRPHKLHSGHVQLVRDFMGEQAWAERYLSTV